MKLVNLDKLISLREQRGWTQRQLAEQANIPHTIIARLEAGTQSDCRFSAIVAIAEVLNVRVDDLLTEPAQIYPDLIPELEAIILILKQQPVKTQKIVAGTVSGLLSSIDHTD